MERILPLPPRGTAPHSPVPLLHSLAPLHAPLVQSRWSSWLWKKGTPTTPDIPATSWKRRWFLLSAREKVLKYWESSADEAKGLPPRGVITLKGAELYVAEHKRYGKAYMEVHSGGIVFPIAGLSEPDAALWTEALIQVINGAEEISVEAPADGAASDEAPTVPAAEPLSMLSAPSLRSPAIAVPPPPPPTLAQPPRSPPPVPVALPVITPRALTLPPPIWSVDEPSAVAPAPTAVPSEGSDESAARLLEAAEEAVAAEAEAAATAAEASRTSEAMDATALSRLTPVEKTWASATKSVQQRLQEDAEALREEAVDADGVDGDDDDDADDDGGGAVPQIIEYGESADWARGDGGEAGGSGSNSSATLTFRSPADAARALLEATLSASASASAVRESRERSAATLARTQGGSAADDADAEDLELRARVEAFRARERAAELSAKVNSYRAALNSVTEASGAPAPRSRAGSPRPSARVRVTTSGRLKKASSQQPDAPTGVGRNGPADVADGNLLRIDRWLVTEPKSVDPEVFDALNHATRPDVDLPRVARMRRSPSPVTRHVAVSPSDPELVAAALKRTATSPRGASGAASVGTSRFSVSPSAAQPGVLIPISAREPWSLFGHRSTSVLDPPRIPVLGDKLAPSPRGVRAPVVTSPRSPLAARARAHGAAANSTLASAARDDGSPDFSDLCASVGLTLLPSPSERRGRRSRAASAAGKGAASTPPRSHPSDTPSASSRAVAAVAAVRSFMHTSAAFRAALSRARDVATPLFERYARLSDAVSADRLPPRGLERLLIDAHCISRVSAGRTTPLAYDDFLALLDVARNGGIFDTASRFWSDGFDAASALVILGSAATLTTAPPAASAEDAARAVDDLVAATLEPLTARIAAAVAAGSPRARERGLDVSSFGRSVDSAHAAVALPPFPEFPVAETAPAPAVRPVSPEASQRAPLTAAETAVSFPPSGSTSSSLDSAEAAAPTPKSLFVTFTFQLNEKLGLAVGSTVGSDDSEGGDGGPFVAKVEPAGAAEKLGVLPNDVLVSVNGTALRGLSVLGAQDVFQKATRPLVLVVSRDVAASGLEPQKPKGPRPRAPSAIPHSLDDVLRDRPDGSDSSLLLAKLAKSPLERRSSEKTMLPRASRASIVAAMLSGRKHQTPRISSAAELAIAMKKAEEEDAQRGIAPNKTVRGAVSRAFGFAQVDVDTLQQILQKEEPSTF